jgi:hypothetical protein
MVKSEIEMLQAFIEEFEKAHHATPRDVEALYDLLNRANALYGTLIPEIAEQREEIIQYSGLLSRNCNAILALLKRELVKQTDNFEAGIMPLTYANLAVYPDAQAVYKDGITKYAEKKYERNVLDDMRLALEIVVKRLLGNDKPLEKQDSDLRNKLSGYHTELVSHICKNIDYLRTYQNRYVKHNDAVNPAEIDYIIEQTSATINFLIRTK